MSLKTWYFGRSVAAWTRDASMGKMGSLARSIWRFLDGKKAILWLGLNMLQLKFPGLPIWGFINSAAHQIGWDGTSTGIDPAEALNAVAGVVALGHRLVKLWKENPLELEWKTIGQVPEVKDLANAVDPPVKALEVPEFEFVEERSKQDFVVGSEVNVRDGRRGIVMHAKERSSAGYVYVVRVVKK